MAKTLYMEQLACSLKMPMIKLIDGSSGTLFYVPFIGVMIIKVSQAVALSQHIKPRMALISPSLNSYLLW